MLPTDLRDDWSISRDGRRVLEDVIEKYRTKALDVRKCYLWTPEFKRMIDPAYEASDADAVRPEDEMERLLEFLNGI